MPIDTFRNLRVYQGALETCLQVFEVTKAFPGEERYGLVGQVRRSSRSVCANLAEAWHKRRYPAAFVAKLNDAESEAAETQVWVDMAQRCGYLGEETARRFHIAYDRILARLVKMEQCPERWTLNLLPNTEKGSSPKPTTSVPSPAPQLPSSPARPAKASP